MTASDEGILAVSLPKIIGEVNGSNGVGCAKDFTIELHLKQYTWLRYCWALSITVTLRGPLKMDLGHLKAAGVIMPVHYSQWATLLGIVKKSSSCFCSNYKERLNLLSSLWVPSAKPEHESAMLTEEPWRLVAEGRYGTVPYMTGVTDLECAGDINRAAHADDVIYMNFGFIPSENSEGATIREQMLTMWTNFAKYDNPTPEVDPLLTVKWPQYNESSPSYLEITAPLRTESNMFEPYMSFWHDLLP